MTSSPAPLSTVGIGSVPYREGEDASHRIFEEWDIPFWPQYPVRSPRENFVFQFLGSFPGLEVSEAPVFDESVYLKRQKEYQKKLDRAFGNRQYRLFEPSGEWALGYSQMRKLLEAGRFLEKEIVKLQVTGPGTVWNSFFSSRTTPKNQKEIQNDLFRTLTAAGLAQVDRIRSFRREPMIFIDDPLLLKNSQPLKTMVTMFKNAGARVGFHSCSSLSSLVGEEGHCLDLDYLHCDLGALQKTDIRLMRTLRLFLEKGGSVVWGLVPTQGDPDSGPKDYSGLLMEWVEKVAGGTLPAEAILARSLLAPACGTGLLSPRGERRVFESLRLTAQGLHKIKNKVLTP